jgi:peptide/nickel transport system substrate-binding protein
MAISDDIATFDPYHSPGFYPTTALAYDSLVNLRPDGRFVSGLAESWTADADSASFTLRPGVTCSDGTPMTASQVVADLRYVGDPANASPLYGLIVPTVPFTVAGDDVAGTVKVTMNKPFGFLLNTIGLLPIVCAKGLKEPTTLKAASAGTGPFVLSKVVPGQSYTYTVRKGYRWGPSGAGVDAPGTPLRVVLKPMANETTASNVLLSGGLNLAKITGADQQRLTGPEMDSFNRPVSGAWLWFNQFDGRPAADERVRQALVKALDLKQVIKVNTGGTGKASAGLVAMAPKPCTGDTVAGQLPSQDVAAAGSLLDAGGWVKGPDGRRHKNGKPLTLQLHYVPSGSPLNAPTAELITKEWEAVGVQVKSVGDSAAVLTQVLHKTRNYDVLMQGFGFTLPTQMVPYFSGPVPPKGTNLAGVHNETYRALAIKAQALEADKACPIWNQAEQSLLRELDIVPIADRPETWFLHDARAQAAGWQLPIPTSLRVLQSR